MNLYFYGGPFHRRQFQVPSELGRKQRLEIRVTSGGTTGGPIPHEWQQVAIYVGRDDRSALNRYFIGMADEG